MDRENKLSKNNGKEILGFLDRHRLEHNPENYTIGFHYVTGTNTEVTKTIKEFEDDGIRIPVEEIKKLASKISKPDDNGQNNAINHKILKIMDIAIEQGSATGEFSKSLQVELEKLGNSGDEMKLLVQNMIARATSAEERLNENAREMEKLRQQLQDAKSDAKKDALTGLPNRRAVDEYLKDLEKNNTTRTIAFVDVDHFKRVNDNWGHAVGDRVLATVGKVLEETCGTHAMVARWGGEEFVLIFRNKTPEDAKTIVDYAREALFERNFKVRENDDPLGKISFSAGIAAGWGETSAIVEKADDLLYKAKEQGRNRVLIA